MTEIKIMLNGGIITFIALINIFMFEMYGGLINQWLVNLAIGLIGTSIIIYGYFKVQRGKMDKKDLINKIQELYNLAIEEENKQLVNTMKKMFGEILESKV